MNNPIFVAVALAQVLHDLDVGPEAQTLADATRQGRRQLFVGHAAVPDERNASVQIYIDGGFFPRAEAKVAALLAHESQFESTMFISGDSSTAANGNLWKYYFTPGDLGFRSFDTEQAQLGVLICWDQWYPEAARLTALQGAEILFYPTAIGWHPEEKAAVGADQHAAWETMQRSHAIANGCFVVAVNRTGFEPDPAGEGGIEFWGQSFVAAPDGRILERAPADKECVLVVEASLGEMAQSRHGWPFFRDRRIDAYSDITQRYLDRD